MKNIRHEVDDSLRPEYSRTDFGKMVRGKYAVTQIEFAELVRLLLACLGEEEGLTFIDHSRNALAARKLGDWTYEIDNATQITLRYWLNESRSLEEAISTPPLVTTSHERRDLQKLLQAHFENLKTRVSAL